MGNILLLRSRRRVFFIKKLRESLNAAGIKAEIIFCDTDHYDPLRLYADKFILMPFLEPQDFKDRILEVIKQHNISLIIPWLDPDISFLSTIRANIEALNCKIAAPQNEVIELFNDKYKNAIWLYEVGLPHPRTILPNGFHSTSDIIDQLKLPIVAKPRFGQGSVGIEYLYNQKELEEWLKKEKKDYILQSFLKGQEYTVDVCQYGHEVYCACPRIRIKTRGGEVLIAKTRLDLNILELSQKIAKKLAVYGVYNFQVMQDDEELHIIEFNPRFGGGSDLTIAAGGDIPQFMIYSFIQIEHSDKPKKMEIKDNYVMTRYHESDFFSDDKNLRGWPR